MAARWMWALAIASGMALASGASLAAGDAANGEKVFKKCKACRTIVAGKNKVGPSLYGVVGRPAGTIAKFKYSKAMKDAGAKGLVWSEDQIVECVADPKAFLKAFLRSQDGQEQDGLQAQGPRAAPRSGLLPQGRPRLLAPAYKPRPYPERRAANLAS